MVKAGANHPSLTKLDFSVGAWWLSGADVLALADVLKRNSTVTDINFHGNSLAAQGATAMAEMLKTNTSITSLNLGTPFTRFTRTQVQILTRRKALLGGNHFTSVGARSLVARFTSTIVPILTQKALWCGNRRQSDHELRCQEPRRLGPLSHVRAPLAAALQQLHLRRRRPGARLRPRRNTGGASSEQKE